MPKKNQVQVFLCSSRKISQATKTNSSKTMERLLLQSLFLQPNNANSLYLYAQLLFRQGKKQMGDTFMQKAYHLNREFYIFNQNQQKYITEQIMISQQKIDQALQNIDKAHKIRWDLIISRFTQCKDMNSCERVLELLKNSCLFEIIVGQCCSEFGLAFYHLGRYDEAYHSYSRVLVKNPSRQKYRNLAVLEYLRQNYEHCLELGLKALNIQEKKCGEIKGIRAFAYCKLNKIKEAHQTITDSISQQPTNVLLKLKKISISIAHFPDRSEEIIQLIKQIGQILQKEDEDKSYFFTFNKQIIHESWHFIDVYYRSPSQQREFWISFLEKLNMLSFYGTKYQFKQTGQLRKIIKQYSEQKC